MAVSIVIDITENTTKQNIANNTSNVTVKVNAKWTQGSYNLLEKSGSCTINGTKYPFTSSFNTGRTTSGSCNLYTKTLDITHNSDGTKTLSVSASYTSGTASGTVAASASKALTTIARKSSLSVANGTLGTALTLTISEQASAMVHKLTYKCGSVSAYILGSPTSTSTALSTSWTPPPTLAAQNTTGTSVSITFYLYTYNGNTLIGTNTYTKTFSIQASVKPSCTVSVSDPTGHAATYGGYIKGISKFKVVVTPTIAQGSAIASYSTTANGVTYTASSFTTGVLKSYGTLTVSATVKDKRGRTGSASQSLTVLNYIQPAVDKLVVKRCNRNGIENDKGDHVLITFGATVTSLNNKNTARYTLRYKKSTEDESAFSEVPMTDYNNVYSVTDATHIFPADTGSSYDVELLISDAFFTGDNAVKSTTSASTAFTLIHWRQDGTGIAFGKIAEEENLFDVGLPARFNESVYGNVVGLNKLPEIPANDDLNAYMTTGCWAVYRNDTASTIANIPVARAGRLEVISSTGEGIRETQWSYLRQKFIPYNCDNAIWERDVSRNADNVWTFYDWFQSSLTPEAAKKVYNKSAITIAISANTTLSAQNTYTKIPLNTTACKMGTKLSLSSNSVLVGPGVDYVKVNLQALWKAGTTAGNRHMRIQKLSNGTTSSSGWTCVYATTNGNTLFTIAPVIVPVKEGDLIFGVYYTGDTTDYLAAGSSANGWQTYLTVEEL